MSDLESMKPQTSKTLFTVAALAVVLPGLIQAQNHYPAGAEGIKAATLPPPGLYFRDYNIAYWADKFPGGPPNFDVKAYVNAPRLIWMTDCTLLGANYGMDVIVPVGYASLRAGGYDESESGLGDIQVEPLLLGWHTKQWDFALAYSLWIPTGDSDAPPTAELGKGFYSHMFTAGATWYPDEKKLWSVTALNRYEIHTEDDDIPVTPGDTWTLEGGIARTLKPGMDLGLVGYWQQQVTDDSAPGYSADPNTHDHVAALGPEITAVWGKVGAQFTLRYLREFEVKDRPEGNTVTLTVTKRF